MSACVESLTKIASLSKSIIESQKNVNGLPELIQYLQGDHDVVVKASLAALDKVYSHIVSQGDLAWLLHSPRTKDHPHDDDDVLHEYRCWMRATYISCRDQLLFLLLHPQYTVAALALQLLMKMVGWEGGAHTYSFPNGLFYNLVARLLENTVEGELLMGQCAQWLSYHDVLFHWLKNIASIISAKLDSKIVAAIPEHFVENVYSALKMVVMPTRQHGELNRFLAGSPRLAAKGSKDGSTTKARSSSTARSVTVLQKYRKHFSNAWLAFLRLRLPLDVLRSVLVDLHSATMPHLLDPRLLLDFLSSAYAYGGVVSLLALNGLFILMSDHHLDYPTFYPKLYQLLEPSIFHVKYLPRFLRLLDTFLSSTHLPLYLVAAFIKKLSRLSLTAPPEGVVLAVVVVTNLTKRHPNCRVLLHRTNVEDFSLTSDPFDLDEPDPVESRALESCLWELKTLQSHYSPVVAKVVCELTNPDSLSSPMETNLEHHLRAVDKYKNVDYETGGLGEVALNYKQPTLLWQPCQQ